MYIFEFTWCIGGWNPYVWSMCFLRTYNFWNNKSECWWIIRYSCVIYVIVYAFPFYVIVFSVTTFHFVFFISNSCLLCSGYCFRYSFYKLFMRKFYSFPHYFIFLFLFCFFGGILDIFGGKEGFMAFWRHFNPFGGFLHGFMGFWWKYGGKKDKWAM